MTGFIGKVDQINSSVNNVVWGVPALVLLIGTGVLMTILTRFFQFRHFGYTMKKTIGRIFSRKVVKSSDKNSISQFQALCTALSATIGTGNIAGVAFAITMGGPGAIFWMWIAAIVGMMTNYSENVLGIFYRRRNKEKEWSGGAMYYLRDGLGARKNCRTLGKVLAFIFSLFAMIASFGIGNMSQVSTIRDSVLTVVADVGGLEELTKSQTVTGGWIIGAVLTVVAFLVIIGGLKRIAETNERIVPFMAGFYILGSLVIVIMNAGQLAPAFKAIFRGAFNFKAAAGGVGGAVIANAMKWGFKRGVFSNEAGLGSSVMVHSTSDVKEPVTQGLWGIFEVFVDTIVVCTLTALVILTSGVVDLNTGKSISGLSELGLATEAFSKNFGSFGGIFLALAVTLFAFSTCLGWSFYGKKAWEYIFGTKSSIIYKIAFLGIILISGALDTKIAINLSDTFNGLMAIPNLIGVLALCGLVRKITKNYTDRRMKGKTDVKPMLSAFPEIQEEQEKALAESDE